MSYRPVVQSAVIMKTSKSNDLFELAVTLNNATKCKVFVQKVNGELIPTRINRLMNVPCPICLKDYYCNCMDWHLEPIFEQSKNVVGEFITAKA